MCVEDLSSNCYHNIILLPVNIAVQHSITSFMFPIYVVVYETCYAPHLCICYQYNISTYIQYIPCFLPVLGNDYTLSPNPTTLTFPAGSTDSDDQCVMIDLEDDTRVEDTEDFTLDLMNPSSGMIGSQNSITVTINNLGMFT